MSMDDYYRVGKPSDQSPETIAHWVASCANLSVIQQYAVKFKPGWITRYSQNEYDKAISSIVSIYRPMSELATRGAMVERGHIDFDEIDLGWIISQAILDGYNWYRSPNYNIGRVFLFSPLATAAGYLFSEIDQIDDPFDITSLFEYTELVIENTTPEDTVNLYKTVVEKKLSISELIHNPKFSLHDEIEKILEDELNLNDMYHYNQQKYVVFEEIASNYSRVANEGLSSFFEIINEGMSYQDAIAHTYINLLSMITDSSVYQQYGRITAQKLRKDALEVVELGGMLTEDGRKSLEALDQNLEQYNNHLAPQTIDDLTTTVTFIATLAGVRP